MVTDIKNGAFIGTMDKRERYDWKPLGKQGTFRYIPKTDLKMDYSYQRTGVAKQKRILKMAANWSWGACATLIVADRNSCGDYWVMDGQGRKFAADRRSDVHELPCMVYDTLGPAEEAEIFILINADRRSMLATEKFNALLESKDPHAAFVNALIQSTGHVVGGRGSADNIRCVGVLLAASEQDQEKLSHVWPLVARLGHNRAITADLVAGAYTLERRALEGASLTRQPWKDRFLRVGFDPMMEAIGRARAYQSGGGGIVCAQGIANAMNKGVRNQRIIFKQPEASDAPEISLRAQVRDVERPAVMQ